MLNNYALSDAEINAILTDLPKDNTQKIAQTLSALQEKMDFVLDMMLRENGENVVFLLASVSFIYDALNNKINQLFEKIENRYEQTHEADWFALLRQCGQLRQTVKTIYSLLQQTNEREHRHYAGLTDAHIQQAVSATMARYGVQ